MVELANDCSRFVSGYFEVISASAPHIYHSALVLAPKNSIVRGRYESHTHPFTKVVYGGPISWDASTAATTRPSTIDYAVWSPCEKFIAISYRGNLWAGVPDPVILTVDVLDSVTLQRVQTLECPRDICAGIRVLIFSPDSGILMCSYGEPQSMSPGATATNNYDDGVTCGEFWVGRSAGWYASQTGGEHQVVTWDLQTGGVVSAVKWERPRQKSVAGASIAYSANGKMIGVALWYRKTTEILTFDVASRAPIDSHSIDHDTGYWNCLWINGESLRFAIANVTTTAIWEVGFTSSATLTEVETLPTPGGLDNDEAFTVEVLLIPAPCRLACIGSGEVQVWDVRNSESLLHRTDAEFSKHMTFSSDGHFFACSTTTSDVYLWGESPTGYTLHGILASSTLSPALLLSQTGKSIVGFSDHSIQLWRTTGLTTSPSPVSTRGPRDDENFALEFSPDETFAVVAWQGDNIVKVLDLKSGVLQLTIDAGTKTYGFGVTESTISVIGHLKLVTWDLPAGYCTPSARVGPEDSSRTIDLHGLPWGYHYLVGASITPDFQHIVSFNRGTLYLYSASIGEAIRIRYPRGLWGVPWLSPDGCNLWLAEESGRVSVWKVDSEQRVLEPLAEEVDIEDPPEGYPWRSSCGYRVTEDWWILGPDGKRLLMLPPHWQSHEISTRVWKGKFLALLHHTLSEPVILELEAKA